MRIPALLLVSACTLLTVACDKPKDQNVAPLPSASSLAPSTPVTTSAKTIKMNVDPKSGTTIDMPAPKEHIKAFTNAATGSLEIDPGNLANSRGEVKIDLTTLTMKHFEDPKDDANQTTHARCWLEVSDCEDQKLDDKTKKDNQYADYAIRSIDNLSATDLSKVQPAKDASGDDVRTVTMTTHGDMLIHGHKAENMDSEVEVGFHYAPGASFDKPKLLTIKSKKPLRVVLEKHDVKPRDNFGKIAKASFHLLGTKVADTADISLDVRATP